LEIRTSVDSAYEKITQVMFESLKQMAKLEGEGEDKGQLNSHVILIGMSLKSLRLCGRVLISYCREHELLCYRNRGNGCRISNHRVTESGDDIRRKSGIIYKARFSSILWKDHGKLSSTSDLNNSLKKKNRISLRGLTALSKGTQTISHRIQITIKLRSEKC